MWKHKNKDEEIEQNKTKYKSSLITSIQGSTPIKAEFEFLFSISNLYECSSFLQSYSQFSWLWLCLGLKMN